MKAVEKEAPPFAIDQFVIVSTFDDETDSLRLIAQILSISGNQVNCKPLYNMKFFDSSLNFDQNLERNGFNLCSDNDVNIIKSVPMSNVSRIVYGSNEYRFLKSLMAKGNIKQHNLAFPLDDFGNRCDESRNNLYWDTEHKLPCLWYGETTDDIYFVKNAYFIISKDPKAMNWLLSSSTSNGDSANASSVSSGYNNDYSNNDNENLSNNNSSSNSNSNSNSKCSSINCDIGSCTNPPAGVAHVVSRCRLIPLDDRVITRYCSPCIFKDFLLALQDFAEWDDALRDSYQWPQFIVNMIKSGFETWVEKALDHPVSHYFGQLRAKLLLFCLCASHVGIQDEYVFKSNSTSGEIDASSQFICLLGDVMELERNVTESCEITRAESRIGCNYQVDALICEDSFGKPNFASSSGTEPVFIPGCISDIKLEYYLAESKSRCQKYAVVGDVVEAPIQSALPNFDTSSSVYQNSSISSSSTSTGSSSNININGTNSNITTSNSSVVSSGILSTGLKNIEFGSVTKSFYDTSFNNKLSIYGDIRRKLHSKYMAVCVITHVETQNSSVRYTVFDGFQTWSIESDRIRLLTWSDEDALQLLHNCNYSFEFALMKLKDFYLQCKSSKLISNWNEKALSDFVRYSSKRESNFYEIWGKMQKLHSNIQYKDVINLAYLVHQKDGDYMTVTHEGGFITGTRVTRISSINNTSKESTFQNVPKNWPSSLPLNRHNVYWMKSNNCPCYCLGMEYSKERGVMLQVMPIASSTYNQISKVQAGALEPFTSETTKKSADERAFYFSLSMIDFCNWEIQNRFGSQSNAEAINSNVLWYTYPHFIFRFLQHSPTWGSWRKQVERKARGLAQDKRRMYFDGLVELYLSLPLDHEDRIRDFSQNPWPNVDMDGEKGSDSENEGTNALKGNLEESKPELRVFKRNGQSDNKDRVKDKERDNVSEIGSGDGSSKDSGDDDLTVNIRGSKAHKANHKEKEIEQSSSSARIGSTSTTNTVSTSSAASLSSANSNKRNNFHGSSKSSKVLPPSKMARTATDYIPTPKELKELESNKLKESDVSNSGGKGKRFIESAKADKEQFGRVKDKEKHMEPLKQEKVKSKLQNATG